MKFLGLLLLAGRAFAGSSTSGDLTITGAMGVGTATPRARLEAQISASDSYGILISSADGTTMFSLDRFGRLGVGTNPAAAVDVAGVGDNQSVGLTLRAGNSTSTALSSQITFGMSSTDTYRHGIRTRATTAQNDLNAIDFYLWNSTGQSTALGSFNVLSFQAISTYSYVSTHVLPAGTPDVELEVSDGVTTGGGRILRAAAGTHSSRALKADIAYFDQTAETRAYSDVAALRHATYRYKDKKGRGVGAVRRGLIYEDAPASVQGAGKTVVLDYRLLNMELALKEADRRIAELEAAVVAAEKSRAGGKR